MNTKAGNTIAVHGGFLPFKPEELTPQLIQDCRAGIQKALLAGLQVLQRMGSSVDAVEAAVAELEDHPLFNAGRGAAFNHCGLHEMDACIVSGQDLDAGAVSCVRGIKNPIHLAKAVFEDSKYIHLSASGALAFAREHGIAEATEDYFFTQLRYDKWQEALHASQQQKRHGTVGAVALDKQGNLAAATSTGGLDDKRLGRVSDSALIGAGTYANNDTCAISCTGEGEGIIKLVAAFNISCLMQYKGLPMEEACSIVIRQKLKELDEEAGLLALDNSGNLTILSNAPLLCWGYVDLAGQQVFGIEK